MHFLLTNGRRSARSPSQSNDLIAITFCWLLLLFLVGLVMAILLLQFPHILMRILHIVVAHFLQDLFQISDRLSGHLHQVFDVVVLMLFECIEQHVQYGIFIVTSLFAFVLLPFLVFNVVLMIRSRLVVENDFVQRLNFSYWHRSLFDRFWNLVRRSVIFDPKEVDFTVKIYLA